MTACASTILGDRAGADRIRQPERAGREPAQRHQSRRHREHRDHQGTGGGNDLRNRGANGVIQIITKKGSGTKPDVEIEVQGGRDLLPGSGRAAADQLRPDGTGGFDPWNGVTAERDSGRTAIHDRARTSCTTSHSPAAGNGQLLSVRQRIRTTRASSRTTSSRQFSAHANVNVAPTPKLDVGTSLNFVDCTNHLGADGGVSAMLGAQLGHIDLHVGFPRRRVDSFPTSRRRFRRRCMTTPTSSIASREASRSIIGRSTGSATGSSSGWTTRARRAVAGAIRAAGPRGVPLAVERGAAQIAQVTPSEHHRHRGLQRDGEVQSHAHR